MKCYYYDSSSNSAYDDIGDKVYTSSEDAEADGLVKDFSDATAATSVQTVTATGTDGDITVITFTDWNGAEYTLGSYTKVTADSSTTLVATGIVAAINANTYITGFTATVGSTGAYTITAPKRWGIYPNTKSVTNTITGTTAITNNAFTGGTRSNLAMFRYQVDEFFRGNPLGVLYFSIGFDDSANTVTAFNSQIQTDILAADNLFQGQARRILAYNPFRAFATSTLTSLKALRTTLFNQYTPSIFMYFGGYTGALSAQSNIRALTNSGVGGILGQSGSGVGFEYSQTQLSNIGCAGLALGIKSAAKVSQSIAEVQAFNLSDGVEMETPEFFEGTNYDTISEALANQLHDYGWIYGKKFKGGFTGTYFNDDNAAVSASDDQAYLSDSETLDACVRDVYQAILPLLNSKNRVNADGTLAEASIAAYNQAIDQALSARVRAEDVNDYRRFVSRTEVVTSTNKIPINIKVQPTPKAKFIEITIGFAATL
jgi:hypothetical protein